MTSSSLYKQTWRFFTIYTDLMYTPEEQKEETTRIQQERDAELHQELDRLKIGMFPKRTSIMMRLIPTLKCVTHSRPNLNIYLCNNDPDLPKPKLIILKHGKIYEPESADKALKIMSENKELPENTTLTSIKIVYPQV